MWALTEFSIIILFIYMSGCKSDSWLFGAHSIGRTYAWVSCPIKFSSKYSSVAHYTCPANIPWILDRMPFQGLQLMCTWWKRSRRRTPWRRWGATSSPGTWMCTPGMSQLPHVALGDGISVVVCVLFRLCHCLICGGQFQINQRRETLMPLYMSICHKWVRDSWDWVWRYEWS